MRTLLRLLVIVGAGAVLVAQQASDDWASWQYAAPITVPSSVEDAALVRLRVPTRATMHAEPGWGDLRVIDGDGREVPYVLEARGGGRTVVRRRVPLLEPSTAPGAYREVVADAGVTPDVHNSVRLTLDTSRNLLGWVEIAVSGDLVDWRVIRERAPIYVLRTEGMGSNTDVSYPDSASRYLRIRVDDGADEQFAIARAEVGFETTAEAEYGPAGVTLAGEVSTAGDSVWTSTGDASGVPVSRVAFEADAATFFRPVVVEESDDGDTWRIAATGDVLRSTNEAGTREWLTVDVVERHAAHWRVTVRNGDDRPVAGLTAELQTTPRWVVFRAGSGASYRLIYGHPRADAPTYDLARLTDARAFAAAPVATLGPEQVRADWVDPAPWTERYDVVLWIALGAAVLVVGAMALRSMRS